MRGIQKKTLVKVNMDELNTMEVVEGGLGNHSRRKGVTAMVESGYIVSPPIASICICTGWVMVGVKDNYLFRECTGDQYGRRCVFGFNQLENTFAVSPAFFVTLNIARLGR